MRVVISFFLALVVYLAILVFLFFTFFKPQKKQKEVLVHTAIIVNKTSKKNNVIKTPKKENKNKIVKKIETKKSVKIGSKSNFSKGGEVSFRDIFKNVKANIPTTPVKLQKQNEISRLKGEILKNLKIKTLQTIDIKVSFSNQNDKNDKDVEEFIKKMDMIWNEISDNVGDFALIKLDIVNGHINVIILDSNLDINKQQLLIQKISNLTYNKNLSLTIKFVTKAKK